jgi:hypothetical protein
MTEDTIQTEQPAQVEQAIITTAKSVIARANRKRFSFGETWMAAVIAGKATDIDKLVAHGVKLQVGTKSDLKRLKLTTLRTKVAEKLKVAPQQPSDIQVSN